MPAVTLTCAGSVIVRNNTFQRLDDASNAGCGADTVIAQTMRISNVNGVKINNNKTSNGVAVGVTDLLIDSSNTTGLVVNGKRVGP